MRRARGFSSRRVLAAAIVAAAAACLLPQRPSPAMQPPKKTTPPPTSSAPAASAPAANLSADAIELSEAERTALEAVRDRTGGFEETALYMLLGRIATFPRLSEAQAEALERPSVRKLVEHPAMYRGQQVRLTVHVALVHRMTVGAGLTRTSYWPDDRPVWRIEGLHAAARYPGEEPVSVLSTEEPKFLPAPDRTTSEGDRLYFGLGPKVRVVGVFYKVYTARTRGDAQRPSEVRDFPLVLAWQLDREGSGGPARRGWFGSQAVLPLLVVLAVATGFLFMRRYVRQRTGQLTALAERQRQLRESRHRTPSAKDDAVDPLLRQAAETFEKERQGRDDPNRPG